MPIKIFFCYARDDEALLKKLKTHLRPLQRQGLIDMWHDRDINAGTEWEREINEHLNTAQIILLLISPDFMDSDYCYGIELKRAIERHERKDARVIPIILRHALWQGEPLGKLQALPRNAKPVKSWYDLDKALNDVAEGIRKVVEDLMAIELVYDEEKVVPQKSVNRLESVSMLERPTASLDLQISSSVQDHSLQQQVPPREKQSLALHRQTHDEVRRDSIGGQKTKEQWLEEGNVHYNASQYVEAVAAFSHAIDLDSMCAIAYYSRGNAYIKLGKQQQAVNDYEFAVKLDPKHEVAYIGISRVFAFKDYKDYLNAPVNDGRKRMLITSKELKEKWQDLYIQYLNDTQLVALHEDVEAQRYRIQREMVVFLNSYLSEQISTEKFREIFDRKTRKEWVVFGLKGMSGAMFLNMLVKYISDEQLLSKQLRSVLIVPEDKEDAWKRMETFVQFLEELISTNQTTRNLIQPNRTPVLISAWWYLQATEKWPVFWERTRKALEYENLYRPTGQPVVDYFAFRESLMSLAQALGWSWWKLEAVLDWRAR